MTPDAEDAPDTGSSATPTAETDARDANASPPPRTTSPRGGAHPPKTRQLALRRRRRRRRRRHRLPLLRRLPVMRCWTSTARARLPGGVQPRHVLALRFACAPIPPPPPPCPPRIVSRAGNATSRSAPPSSPSSTPRRRARRRRIRRGRPWVGTRPTYFYPTWRATSAFGRRARVGSSPTPRRGARATGTSRGGVASRGRGG